MGMFTIINHPKTGKEIQIKTGDDFLDTYNVGDNVDRHINPDYFESGCCFDGCYDGYGDGKRCIVIIKNKIVKCVIDVNDDDMFYDVYEKYNALYPYKIPYFEYTLLALIKSGISSIKWKIWEIKQKLKNNKIHKSFVKKFGKEKGTEHYFGYLMSTPLRQKLDYVGIASKFIITEPFPNGEPLIYDKEKK